MSNEERLAALMLWLEEREISYQALADVMGVSRPFIQKMLHRDTIPAKRHKQLVALGIPEELLPSVFTGLYGRPPSPRNFVDMMPRAQEPSTPASNV